MTRLLPLLLLITLSPFFTPTTIQAQAKAPIPELEMATATFEAKVFPNPFYQSADVDVTLKTDQKVSVVVYNLLGKKVATLHDGWLTSGKHSFEFKHTESGQSIFFVQISTEDDRQTVKLVKKDA